MGYTAPTTRSTGDLITASIWNTDNVDNIAYLKGTSGNVELEASLLSDTDITDDLGSAAVKWKAIHGRTLFGSRMRVNPNIREVRITWEYADITNANSQWTDNTSGAGSTLTKGGSGQIALKVDNDAGGTRSARMAQLVEQDSAINNAWTISKNPYMRWEFSLNAEDANAEVFIGFRATISGSIPATTEIHAGLSWDGGGNWTLSTSDGTTTSKTNLTTDPTAGARHVLEIYINGTTAVELYLDGILQITKATNKPTGTLEWEGLVDTDGAGGATDSILTLGQLLLQEEL